MTSADWSTSHRVVSRPDGVVLLGRCAGIGALGAAVASILNSTDFPKEGVDVWLTMVGGWFGLAVELPLVACAGLLVVADRDGRRRTCAFTVVAVAGVVAVSANLAGVVGALWIRASQRVPGLTGQATGVILGQAVGVVVGCVVVLLAAAGLAGVGRRRVAQGDLA